MSHTTQPDSLPSLTALRHAIQAAWFRDETEVVQERLRQHQLDQAARQRITAQASAWVDTLRADPDPNLMESFLAEYGLSTDEGVALMCLAEAYLRVPDAPTLDALIRDKIGGADWGRHGGEAGSLLVNASTWALMLTGRVFRHEAAGEGKQLSHTLRKLVQRVGEPVVRAAVGQAMRVMGQQFVLGRSIEEAFKRAEGMLDKGYLHSFDMLGEAARTEPDARRYFRAYSKAITSIAEQARQVYVHDNPGISVKLSALHPRYEGVNRERVMQELVPRVAALAELARNANIGFNIDAEEAERLDLSLKVIEAVLRNPDLQGWDGFGVVVQAYAKHSLPVLAWVRALAQQLGRKIAVRLVKGAYWDMEIKQAQVLGLPAYPVFTRKTSTDVSYLAGARFLLENRACLYPQFATHNAQTVAAIQEMAGESGGFEFQRLHGMGEALHELLRQQTGHRSRIYAPVGVHEDLLAYLVRRLLENGANSSFVNQLLDTDVPVAALVSDPVAVTESLPAIPHAHIPLPPQLFGAHRRNSQGWNINQPLMAAAIEQGMAAFRTGQWHASPIVGGQALAGMTRPVLNPAVPQEQVGEVQEAGAAAVAQALATALAAFPAWRDTPVVGRAALLEAVADQYEAHAYELMALLSREAGKTRLDAVLEVREAVDFLRYYAAEARRQFTDGKQHGLGVFVCISPWNFPLAIFTGQVAAALVAGNSVIAKPAEQTPLIAARAVGLMLAAGIPAGVLALLPGEGGSVGAALTRDPLIAGVCFTGSTATAILIDRALAAAGNVRAPLIAETGGLNAMLVDSTALPEAAVRDMVNAAFQSAGQRCSALRAVFIQTDIWDKVLTMLEGATRELRIGNPWAPATDVGPVIDAEAQAGILAHCAAFKAKGRVLFQHPFAGQAQPADSLFVPPTAIALDSFAELDKEIFGPVLHVIPFRSEQVDEVLAAINASGYGLTLGMHSRLDDRVASVCQRARVGNLYVNRNQIGAVVGVQPFGGEGLSGTGPKAGGPHYLARFSQAADAGWEWPALVLPPLALPKGRAVAAFVADAVKAQAEWDQRTDRALVLAQMFAALPDSLQALAQQALAAAQPLFAPRLVLPGPTGESNQLGLHGRGIALCLGDGTADSPALLVQTGLALAAGNAVALPESRLAAVLVAAAQKARLPAGLLGVMRLSGNISPDEVAAIRDFPHLALVALEGTAAVLPVRQALAQRAGVRVQCVALDEGVMRFCTERVVSIDTTAAGGNASLLTLG